MRSLFLKIFFWFWAAMVLIGLALFLLVLTTQPNPLPQAWRVTEGQALTATAAGAVAEWERGGQSALAQYLVENDSRARARFGLFRAGQELSGLPLLPEPGREQGRAPSAPLPNAASHPVQPPSLEAAPSRVPPVAAPMVSPGMALAQPLAADTAAPVEPTATATLASGGGSTSATGTPPPEPTSTATASAGLSTPTAVPAATGEVSASPSPAASPAGSPTPALTPAVQESPTSISSAFAAAPTAPVMAPPEAEAPPPPGGPPPHSWFHWPGFNQMDGPPTYSRLEALRLRCLLQAAPAFALAGPTVMAAQSFHAPSGRNYVVVAILPRPDFGRPAADPRTQFLGGLVVLVLSGLVCYGLVSYLTAPLIMLRVATARLAEGDLASRTGAATRGRRDEVADLGRDFDRMAERIETLVQAQQRLIGDISHELRSPLSRINMALALARRQNSRPAAPEKMNQVLDRIGTETKRLASLIGQLLELAFLENSNIGQGKVAVDLEQLVRDVTADADFEAQARRMSVRLANTKPCTVSAVPLLLRSALENVIRNALRHGPFGSRVEVSLDRLPSATGAGNWAVIRVRDYGSGVPPQMLDQIFQPFFRAEDARDRRTGGVGLGLAITERAIRAHGGTVRASNCQDGGLQVELRLPISEPRPASSAGKAV